MNDCLSVIGAGGHGMVVIATALAAGFDVKRVFDDDGTTWGKMILGVPVEGPIEAVVETGGKVVLGIGDNEIRKSLSDFPVDWVEVVHPSSVVDRSVRLGAGAVVFAGSVIQPNSIIGEHSIVNTGATVDHDCILEPFVHVAPGVSLSGGVHLEEGAFMGVGSCAMPGVRVGCWTTVGAGAVVHRNVGAGVTVVGIPAKPLIRGEHP